MRKGVVVIFVVLCLLAVALAYTGYLLYKFLTLTKATSKPAARPKTSHIVERAQTHALGPKAVARLRKLVSKLLNTSMLPANSAIIHSRYQMLSVQISIPSVMPVVISMLEKFQNVTFGYVRKLNLTYVSVRQGIVALNYAFAHFSIEFTNFEELARTFSNGTVLMCMRGKISIKTTTRTGSVQVGFCNVSRVNLTQPQVSIKGLRNLVKILLGRVYSTSNITGIEYANGTECLIYRGVLNISKFIEYLERYFYRSATSVYMRIRLKQILESSFALWHYRMQICLQRSSIYPIIVQLWLENINRTLMRIDVHYRGVIDSIEINKINERLVRELMSLPRENMSGLERLLEEVLIKSPTVI